MSQWACATYEDPDHPLPLLLVFYHIPTDFPRVFPRTAAAAGKSKPWELVRNANSQAPAQIY